MAAAVTVAGKYTKLASMMNEKLKRRWAGCEALALGRGGVSRVSEATGMSRATIRKGVAEVSSAYPALASQMGERIRQPGGGRPTLTAQNGAPVGRLEAFD